MKIYVDPYGLTMSDELYHHGVKGQKKGVRRYQYPDGRLTPEGYIHYGLSRKENASKGAKYLMKTPKHGLAAYGLHMASKGAAGAAVKSASVPILSKTASAKAVTAALTKASKYAALGSTAAIALTGAEALAGLGLIAHSHYSNYKVKQSSELDRLKYEEEQRKNKPKVAMVHSDLLGTDVLVHFGIPGMKWYRRRWQNPDGSLTLAGYEHYGYTKKGVLTKKGKKYEEKRIKKMDLNDSQKESIKDKSNVTPKENAPNNKEAENRVGAGYAARVQAKMEQKQQTQQKKKEKLYNKGQISEGEFMTNAFTNQMKTGQKAINSVIDTLSNDNYVSKANRDLLKKYKDISTRELQQIVERERAENDYLAAREQRSKYSKGRRVTKGVVTTAVSAATIATGAYFTKKLWDNYFA